MKPTEQALLEDAASKLEATPYLNLYDAGDNRVVPDTRALARAIRAALGMDAALSATQQPVSGYVLGGNPFGTGLSEPKLVRTNAIEADTLRPILEGDEARAALSATQQPVSEQGWRPIETAPKDGDDILVCCGPDYDPMYGVASWDEGGWQMWWEKAGEPRHSWPTHWMPLPPAPDAIEAEQGEKEHG